MGRTVATMTQIVDQEAGNFSQFRRALRREDQEVFDRLFGAARHHAAPAAYQSHASPFETILLAMLLEVGKAVLSLQRRLVDLEQEVRTLEHSEDRALAPAGEQGALPLPSAGQE